MQAFDTCSLRIRIVSGIFVVLFCLDSTELAEVRQNYILRAVSFLAKAEVYCALSIFVDPIGVVCAVLVVEAVVNKSLALAPITVAVGLLSSVTIGFLVGLVAASSLLLLLRRHIFPDELHVPLLLFFLVGGYWASESLHPESGLLFATVFGAWLGNRGGYLIHHLIEFTDRAHPMLLSVMFLLLSSRLSSAHLQVFSLPLFLFVAVLIFVVRPAAVFAATTGNKLNISDKLLLSSVAPRGIVAASLGSVLAGTLEQHGVPGAEYLVGYVFLTIIFSVVCYAGFSPWVCRRLKLQQLNPQGVLVIGASAFARDFSEALRAENVLVRIIDTERWNVAAARRRGIDAVVGNVLSDNFQEMLDVTGFGRVVALTDNDEANTLIAVQYSRVFGRRSIFQLAPSSNVSDFQEASSRGRVLFSQPLSFDRIAELLTAGHCVKIYPVASAEEAQKILSRPAAPIVLAVKEAKDVLTLCSGDAKVPLQNAVALIVLQPPNEEASQ